ncbi:phosphomevalonate kinase [Oceanobacillus massiliensis]|uniref:phosphomevalonate kinase n=1 Tax=Oceanobacillus massiliensis TaxID=1465765 RepID=UPI00301A05BC
MSNRPITIRVPGKLMIAGEFAVLEPNHHLAVMAVDRFVYATIHSSDSNELTLQDFSLYELGWSFKADQVEIASDDSRVGFVSDAMSISCTYLREKKIELAPFSLSIRSELDDESGIKYGLGSSAAVVTSVVSAILHRFLDNPSSELIFKLAAISHVKTQGNGSGADVAASSFGGLLQYASFQAEWLRNAYVESESISALLEMDWIYYSLQKIEMPKNVYFCVGWTGKPASTSKLVDKILQLKTDHPDAFQSFLEKSDRAVSDFLKGMDEDNVPLLLKGVKQNREALATVGGNADTLIETPLLTKLCDLAESLGGAGKPSGAGGGDCGIAFMPSKEKALELMKAWEEAGIKPLTIQPSRQGASPMEQY